MIEALIDEAKKLAERERIELYNRISSKLRELIEDVCNDPVAAVQLVPAQSVHANDYNPNRTAAPEMDLLEQSIRCDGITMPVVVVEDPSGNGAWIVVDGFHRTRVCKERLHRQYIPVSVIDKPLADRMASTVRHNRARGKHQVDLMAEIVRSLVTQGWSDKNIAVHVGMTEEELLRLKQTIGVAKLLAASDYSRSFGNSEDCDL
jgi:ParB-like chromosome segregation protein Spo0J